MRTLCLLAVTAGLAGAQCYSFSAPGVTYTMNIMGVTTSQYTATLSNLIVQQQSTLTVGGKTYTAAAGPGNVIFQSEGGESIYMSAALQLLTTPVWQVNINLIGMLTLLPQLLPRACRRCRPGASNRRRSNIRLTANRPLL